MEACPASCGKDYIRRSNRSLLRTFRMHCGQVGVGRLGVLEGLAQFFPGASLVSQSWNESLKRLASVPLLLH
jgi:hypothetical protein